MTTVARAARRRGGRDLLSDGLTALCGGALALNLLLVVGLLVVLVVNGLSYFWQPDLVRIERADGSPCSARSASASRSSTPAAARAAATGRRRCASG